MRQRDLFTRGEGDRYHERNREALAALAARPAEDPFLAALARLAGAPARLLEVGAGNGWRLAAIRDRHPRALCLGLEPSEAAARDAARSFGGITVCRGTAERLPFADRAFDWVLLGFCLYLCDREDLFRIAAEVDRVLAPEGHVAIHDFTTDAPQRAAYAHFPGAYSYKMDHSRMFLWNPLYRLVLEERRPHAGLAGGDPDQVALTVLRRSAAHLEAE